MAISRIRRGLAALSLCALCAPALADRSTEQIALAAGGRYDQLEQQLEALAARAPLDTRDRHALCYAYSKTKRYNRLMACLDQLEQSLKQGSRRTRLFALDDATPALGIMRAEALIELGQYPAAIAAAGRNLQWLKDERSDDLDMVFNTLAALSIAHAMAGARAPAQRVAGELAQTSAGLFGPYAGAKALALARARMALADYPGVIAALDSDKSFAVNVFLDRLVSGGFLTGVNNWVWAELPRAFMMSKALLESGRAAEAKSGFERLLAIRQAQENGEIYWLLLNDRGRIAEQEGDLAAALDCYRRAIDIVERQRASINTEASKIGFVGDKQALYARAIAAALALNQPALAYDYMERAKSRALVDLLAAKSSAPLALKTLDAPAQALLGAYRQAADEAAAQLPLDMAGAPLERGAAGPARALRQREPELASLVTVESLPLAQVRTYLQPDETLVEYYLNGKELVLVAAAADSVVSARIDAATLEQDIRAFRALIEAQDGQALAAGQALYARLLGPVERQIAGRNLVIVPHGPLHYLPFAALHDGKHYLIEERNLRYLPSASVQQYLRPQPAGARLNQMLIYGNPDLGRAELDLPSAEEEARLIAQMVPEHTILTRRAASETAFKRLAGQFAYLHVAAHGQFKGDTPLQSRLVLAADADNDGSLTLGEIYDLRLNADLVTLSACETGLGTAMSGDDLIGMTRGFLYAGSSNIIASLWQVDDAATAQLMQQFYRNLLAGQSKKEALRQAQRSLWPRFPQPMFWAAFYLTGQGR